MIIETIDTAILAQQRVWKTIRKNVHSKSIHSIFASSNLSVRLICRRYLFLTNVCSANQSFEVIFLTFKLVCLLSCNKQNKENTSLLLCYVVVQAVCLVRNNQI